MTFIHSWFNRILQQAIIDGIGHYLETERHRDARDALSYFLQRESDQV